MIEINTISLDEEFDAIQEEWNALYVLKANPNPYISYNWMREWWRYFSTHSLVLVTGRVHGKLIGVAPLCARARSLYGVGSPDVDMYEFLMKPGMELEFIERFLDWFSVSRYKKIELNDVPEYSKTFDLLQGKSVVEHTTSTPVIDYSDSGNNTSICSKLQKRITRIRNKADITFSFEDSYEELQEAIDCIVSHQQTRLKEKDEKSRFIDPNYVAFYDALVKRLAARNMVRLMKINADGESIGWQIMFYDVDEVFGYTASADYSYRQLSPGGVLLNWGACSFIDSDIDVKKYNLGRGEHEYKLKLSNLSYKNMRLMYSKQGASRVRSVLSSRLRSTVRSNEALHRIAKRIKRS